MLINIYIFLLKAFNKVLFMLYGLFAGIFTWNRMTVNKVRYGKGFKSNGIPVIHVKKSGTFKIGMNFTMNNGKYYNQIGRQQPCYFIVGANSHLDIGNNVGISATAIVCMEKITIEDNVKIGGNTVIYDTDFHSLDANDRMEEVENKSRILTKPVLIKRNAFIGAHATILKGVTVGENSIIGAGSVVSKNIPDNEIWGGNPAKFIRNTVK